MNDAKCPSLFDWGNPDLNLEKRITDDRMISDMLNHPLGKKWINRTIVAVTLCGSTFTFENMLAEYFKQSKFLFYPIEKNKKVYEMLIEKYFPGVDVNNFYMFKAPLKEHPNCEVIMLSKPVSVYEYFSNPTFDLIDYINLDYMGTISKEKIQDITKAYSSTNLNKEIFLSLTIGGNRGHNNSELFNTAKSIESNIIFPKIRGKVKTTVAKTLGVVATIEKISKKFGYKTNCINYYPYYGYGEHRKQLEYKFLFYSKKA